MRILTASAFALVMVAGIGTASACEFHMQSMAYSAPGAGHDRADDHRQGTAADRRLSSGTRRQQAQRLTDA